HYHLLYLKANSHLYIHKEENLPCSILLCHHIVGAVPSLVSSYLISTYLFLSHLLSSAPFLSSSLPRSFPLFPSLKHTSPLLFHPVHLLGACPFCSGSPRSFNLSTK